MSAPEDVRSFDLVIVGAGSGNSIITPDMDDWSIAMVEEWVFGGTCLNRGCIPTKMFVHAADVVETVAHAARLGVDASIEGVRWRDIRDRVFGRIDPIADSGTRYRVEDCPNITVFAGRGRFEAPRRLRVTTPDGEHVIEGRQVVIAAGARPMLPVIHGLDEVGHLTSDDIMRVDEVPEHLIVIGGGFIACELAHVFGSFGSTVTIVQRGMRLLSAEDHDVSAALTTAFSQRFDLRLGVQVDRVTGRNGDRLTVHLHDGTRIDGTHLLVATGRVPNSDVIDAAAGGLAVHPDGRIVVDEFQRTTEPGVWALGDVSSPFMLKHVANHEARVVAHNVVHAHGRPSAGSTNGATAGTPNEAGLRATDHRVVPHAVFTNPQIASVGPTEMEAVAAGHDVMVSVHRYSDVAYGWALEDTTSFCKLVADRSTRRLLGAHIIGPHASSLLQQLVQGITFGQTIDEMATGQYYVHPALGEVVENALLAFPAG